MDATQEEPSHATSVSASGLGHVRDAFERVIVGEGDPQVDVRRFLLDPPPTPEQVEHARRRRRRVRHVSIGIAAIIAVVLLMPWTGRGVRDPPGGELHAGNAASEPTVATVAPAPKVERVDVAPAQAPRRRAARRPVAPRAASRRAPAAREAVPVVAAAPVAAPVTAPTRRPAAAPAAAPASPPQPGASTGGGAQLVPVL